MEQRTSNSSIDSTAVHDSHTPQLDKVLSYSDVEKPHGCEDIDVVEDFPDGGLRAWLVVLGVRTLPLHKLVFYFRLTAFDRALWVYVPHSALSTLGAYVFLLSVLACTPY